MKFNFKHPSILETTNKELKQVNKGPERAPVNPDDNLWEYLGIKEVEEYDDC